MSLQRVTYSYPSNVRPTLFSIKNLKATQSLTSSGVTTLSGTVSGTGFDQAVTTYLSNREILVVKNSTKIQHQKISNDDVPASLLAFEPQLNTVTIISFKIVVSRDIDGESKSWVGVYSVLNNNDIVTTGAIHLPDGYITNSELAPTSIGLTAGNIALFNTTGLPNTAMHWSGEFDLFVHQM